MLASHGKNQGSSAAPVDNLGVARIAVKRAGANGADLRKVPHRE
jgi:hypothetical protein